LEDANCDLKTSSKQLNIKLTQRAYQLKFTIEKWENKRNGEPLTANRGEAKIPTVESGVRKGLRKARKERTYTTCPATQRSSQNLNPQPQPQPQPQP
jgi:hypothetical protein